MLWRALVITLCLTVPTVGPAEKTSAAGSLEGVWKIVETVTTGADAATITDPQPSLVIFTKGHYGVLSVHGAQPRPQFAPPKDPNKLTDAEKIARYEQWSRFTANAGTYEVKGATLTRRPPRSEKRDCDGKEFIVGERVQTRRQHAVGCYRVGSRSASQRNTHQAEAH